MWVCEMSLDAVVCGFVLVFLRVFCIIFGCFEFVVLSTGPRRIRRCISGLNRPV